MSTLNITDLLRELQAGEEARARIPAFEREIDSVLQKNDGLSRHNQELELAIVNYKRAIADLTQTVARLEVERDDAGFRELEAQERVLTLTNTLRAIAGNVAHMVHDVDPPKPEPVAPQAMPDASVSVNASDPYTGGKVDPVHVPIVDHGAERAADPTASAMSPETGGNVQSTTASQSENASPSSMTEQSPVSNSGESAPHPTASVQDTGPSANASSTPAESMAVSSDKSNSSRPYHDKPDTISWEAWVAAGNEAAPWLKF